MIRPRLAKLTHFFKITTWKFGHIQRTGTLFEIYSHIGYSFSLLKNILCYILDLLFFILYRTQEIKPSGPNISKRVKNVIKNPKRELETTTPKPSPTISAINLKPKTAVVSPLSVPHRQPSSNVVTSTTSLPRSNAVTSSNITRTSVPSSTKPAPVGNPAVMQKPFRYNRLQQRNYTRWLKWCTTCS